MKKSLGRGALIKVAMDQILFAPIFLFVFITAANTLNGKDWKYIRSELNEKYFGILLVNYTVWPFVQTINFYAVPVKYQVLFAQTVAIFWNTYLCWMTKKL